MNRLRIGFHYHIPAVRCEDRGIQMPGYLGRFVDSLASECDRVVCFMHRPDETRWVPDYTLESENVDLVALPAKGSVPNRILRGRRMTTPIRQHQGMVDVLLIRGPSPLLPAAANAVSCPTALLLVGDYLKGIDGLPQPRWRKELIRLWSWWNKIRQDRAAGRSLVLVNSRPLFREYESKARSVVETRTTTLRKIDFFERDDTCLNSPVTLLYTGRFDRAKGLEDVIRALGHLRDKGIDAKLNAVGWADSRDTVQEDCLRIAENLGFGASVSFLGFKPLGDELFRCYREADIYMLASRVSEGFPRTIFEAMSQSTPVVASRVGSIPDFLSDGGSAILVDPNHPEAIADAVNTLVRNPELRRRLIRNGRLLARENTLEVRSKELVSALRDYCASEA